RGAHFFAGRYSDALTWAEMARRAQPVHAPSNALAAASGALVGNRAAADVAMARLRQLMPELRMSNLKDFVPIRRLKHFVWWAGPIRQAGPPEGGPRN